jgi:hypothetical protein
MSFKAGEASLPDIDRYQLAPHLSNLHSTSLTLNPSTRHIGNWNGPVRDLRDSVFSATLNAKSTVTDVPL